METTEKQIISHSEAQNLEGKQIHDHCKEEGELSENEVDECFQSLELEENQVHDFCRLQELKERQKDGHCILDHYQEQKLREKETDGVLELKEKRINEQLKAQSLGEKQIDVPSNCLGSKEKQKVSSSPTKVRREQPLSDITYQVSGAGASSSLDTCGGIQYFCQKMDANGVISYLLEHVKEHTVWQEIILDALRLASDPAKLVLDVCQGLHVILLDRFHRRDNKTSCVYLLEQLMKVSPHITPEVKDEARKFAAIWIKSLKKGDSRLDTFGFFQFLAAYKLAGFYNPQELLSHFKTLFSGNDAYRPEQAVYLCRALGLVKMLPGLITSLIDGQEWLTAVKLICFFKLERDFPPVPLLKQQLEFAKQIAEDKQMGEKARRKELTALRDIVKYISDFKLEFEFPPDPLVFLMSQLENRGSTQTTNPRDTAQHQASKKRSASPGPTGFVGPQQEKKQCRVAAGGGGFEVGPPPPWPHPHPRPHYGPPFEHPPPRFMPDVHHPWPHGPLPAYYALPLVNHGFDPHLAIGPFAGPFPGGPPPPYTRF